MEMMEVETSVSILTTKVENINDENNSSNPSKEFRETDFNTIKEFPVISKPKVESSVSILTTEIQNINDNNNSLNPSNEFRETDFNSIKEFPIISNSKEDTSVSILATEVQNINDDNNSLNPSNEFRETDLNAIKEFPVIFKPKVVTSASILTTEVQNINDDNNSLNPSNEFREIDFNTIKEFHIISKPREVMNIKLVQRENENNEFNEDKRSPRNEQTSHVLTIQSKNNKNQENTITRDMETDLIVEDQRKSPIAASEGEKKPLDFQYKWMIQPKLLCAATEEYTASKTCENFTKGCQWSPDGTCLLVPSEDYRIRIYELPRELYSEEPSTNLKSSVLKPALCIKEGGLIYDSCWYPYMNSWDPATCCFLSTSQETPIHLWDAFTGKLRATYRAYNQVDEVEPAISVRFINSGTEVWSGFKGALRKFVIERPGRQTEDIFLKRDFPNISGLVSCIRENPIMPGLVAFGTYAKYIGLYQNGPICCFKTSSGVTQVKFSPCGIKLYTAVRRNNEFFCWDLRNPGVVLWSLENRQANTNQKIQFDVSRDGSTIVSGGTDGLVNVWKTDAIQETEEEAEELHPIRRIRLSKDCINGVSLHHSLPLLATSSGQRICDEEVKHRDNSVRLWWFGSTENI